MPGGRQLEAAIPGIGEAAVRLQHLEEAVALYRHVEGVLGGDHIALDMHFFGGDDARTGAQHQACRCAVIGRGLPPRLTHVLVEQVLEHRATALEAVGVDVGQVV